MRFLKRFVENKERAPGAFRKTSTSYRASTPIRSTVGRSLRTAVEELSQNRLQLEAHEEAGPALAAWRRSSRTRSPTACCTRSAALTHTARSGQRSTGCGRTGPGSRRDPRPAGRRHRRSSTRSRPATRSVQRRYGELAKLLETAAPATSIAHIAQARQAAEAAYDRALTAIEEAQAPPPSRWPSASDSHKVKKRRVVEAKAYWSDGLHRERRTTSRRS